MARFMEHQAEATIEQFNEIRRTWYCLKIDFFYLCIDHRVRSHSLLDNG